MSEKKKLPILDWILLTLFTLASVAAIIFSPYLFGEASFFNQPMFENALLQLFFTKVPAVIRTVQIITFATLLRIVLNFFMTRAIVGSKRSITLAKLLNSFVKWIIGIIAVLLILSTWGVDTATLIASAGILSLIIGLGSQSLVADIIAGLFIVVEGEYQVGDIVVIDNWRGEVTEIGIRTTKIKDAGGNIKIVNNSEIKTVINQTQALSVAKATVSIEYGESLSRVELVIRDNLDSLREKIPDVMEGPFYKGVTALSASGVDLLFLATCREENIFQVQRDLNRALKLLFDEHNINIPFQQVVLHQAAAASQKANEAITSDSADAFLVAQKELSKGLEERPEE